MTVSGDGRKWITGECFLNLSSPTLDVEWQKAIRLAMDKWNAVTPKFSFKEDSVSGNSIAAHDLGRWNGWIAMTNTQPLLGTTLAYADILFNLYYKWDPPHRSVAPTDTGGAYDLETIAAHELGHGIYLEDDSTPGANTMMAGSIQPAETRTLQPDDEAGLRSVYP